MAAVFNVLLDGVHGRLLIIVLGTADDQNRAVARDFGAARGSRRLAGFRSSRGSLSACTEQGDGLRLVIVLLEGFLHVRIGVAIRAFDAVLARAGHEANGPLSAF